MTDRGRDALRQTPSQFTVGPSSMRWQDGKLVIHVDEVSSLPLVSRVRGTITLTPDAVTGVEVALTPDGAHVWRPFAPSARIDVDLGRRGHWSGHGYFDANFGTRALEADFSYWTWGRYPLKDGAALFYDAVLRDGSGTGTALRMDGDGQVAPMQAPPKARLKRSLWAVRRETRADAGHAPKQEMSMLDAPFYTRTAVSTRIEGEPTTGVHEALDLDRFRGPWLMPMLAVRVPRRPGWRF
nr:carotenoid 1,2-hydratase [Palleronia pontilimi]